MPNNMTPYGQMPGGVATGHVPQQPNLGLGPNRYVPPTFNWGQRVGDNAPNYRQMDWNQMQAFYMPQQQNNTFTNPYMQQLQGMLGQFSMQYGSPNRQPTLPQFGSYNPGFGGPTSFYDQSLQDWGRSAMDMQRNMGRGPQGQGEYQMYGGGGNALPEGYSYNAPEGWSYTMEMPRNGGQWAYGPNGERIEVGGNQRGPGAAFFRDLFGGDGDTGMGGGGLGVRGGYPMMPQFNPYMLARNNMGGMDFNEMFDPRYAMLFGMGGLGAMRPQGFAATQPQQPPSTANGQKPLAIGGGG